MNKVSPKSLLNSKWTKSKVSNKEKHFIVTKVEFNEDQKVIECVVEAVINCAVYSIDWRDLKQPQQWKIGWQ
jgi:tryptophan-rich hypothetical protein